MLLRCDSNTFDARCGNCKSLAWLTQERCTKQPFQRQQCGELPYRARQKQGPAPAQRGRTILRGKRPTQLAADLGRRRWRPAGALALLHVCPNLFLARMADLTHCNLPVGTTIKGAACQHVIKPTISPGTGEAPDANQASARQQPSDAINKANCCGTEKLHNVMKHETCRSYREELLPAVP